MKFLMYSLAFMCPLLAGCWTGPGKSYVDTECVRVFIDDSEKAPLKRTTWETLAFVTIRVDETGRYWLVNDGKLKVDSVIGEMNKFIKDKEVKRNIVDYKLLTKKQLRDIRYQNGSRYHSFIPYRKDSGYSVISPRMTIVAIKPLIVIIEKNKFSFYHKLPSDRKRILYGPIRNDWNGSETIGKFDLPYGYEYGSDCWFDDDMKWFSPDLDVPPQDLEVVSDTEKRIKVPWGWLVFKYELINIEYPVYSSEKRQPETSGYTGYHWRVYAESSDYYTD